MWLSRIIKGVRKRMLAHIWGKVGSSLVPEAPLVEVGVGAQTSGH